MEVVGRVPEGFDLAREKLTSAKVLTHYTPILPIRLAGDASTYGIGAVVAHVETSTLSL